MLAVFSFYCRVLSVQYEKEDVIMDYAGESDELLHACEVLCIVSKAINF